MYHKLKIILFKHVQRKDFCNLDYDFKVFAPCNPKQTFSTFIPLMKRNSKENAPPFEKSNTHRFFCKLDSLKYYYFCTVIMCFQITVLKLILKEILKRKFVFHFVYQLLNLN